MALYEGQLQRGASSLATGHKWSSGHAAQIPLGPVLSSHLTLKPCSLGGCLHLLGACSPSEHR